MKLSPYDYRYKDILERSCNELMGICKGVLSDNTVNQKEAEFLLDWLNHNQNAAAIYPGNILAGRLAAMLQDGVLDQEESQEMFYLLKDLTGQSGNGKTSDKSSMLGLDDPLPEICVEETCYCLTGTFEFGMREEVEAILKRLGAVIKNDIPKKQMCYLVVGKLVSDAWKFSTYGRKLEKAVMLRDQGYLVSIIPEDHLWSELTRLGYAAL